MNLSYCGLMLNIMFALTLSSNTSNALVMRDLRTLETIVNLKSVITTCIITSCFTA